ncbi:preprotein translocase subunit SecG [candidate division KSB1 bacterium]
MGTLLIFLHILISVLLMVVVLLQSSKGGGLAGAFGGSGGMGAVFGSRGTATFLSKLTTILAVLFMLSCIGQSLYSRSQGRTAPRSVIEQERDRRAATSPAASLPGIPKTTENAAQIPAQNTEQDKPPVQEENK